jgi:hypothetical protein
VSRRNRHQGGRGKSTPLKKQSDTTAMTPPVSREIGQPGIPLTRGFYNDLQVRELDPQRIHTTIDEMVLDPDVKHPLRQTQNQLNLCLAKGEFTPSKTRKGKMIAEYANYLLHNMKGQGWLEACRNFNSDVERGYSLSEIVVRKAENGPYKGSWVLSHLGPRSQRSVYAWIWDKYDRHVTHVVQKPLRENMYMGRPPEGHSYLGNVVGTDAITTNRLTANYPIIAMNKLLHFRYDAVDNNPQGRTPLLSCYAPWREKVIINKYQVIGITRDFGGIPIARLPSELMRRANDPEHKYPLDEIEYQVYQEQLANMHAGKQSYFMLSSDLVEGSSAVYEYDLKLLGIDGGGKQFDVSEIIKTKKTEIYNAFGAGHLMLGQEGNTSSYNLSSAGMSVHSLTIEEDLMSKAAVIERLVPMMLDFNNIKYEHKDLPKFRYSDTNPLSLDEAGKFLQRAKSVGALTEEGARYIYRLMGLPEDGIEELDFNGKDESKAGLSMGSSGQGDTQAGGVASSTNMENKQLDNAPKNFVLADSYGDTNVLIDEDGKAVFVPKGDIE